MGRTDLRASRLLPLLPALLLLPFLDKAFHVDDRLFLDYADLVARAPLHPFAQSFLYEGAQKTLFDQPNPLLWPYCLALWRAVAGESEVALHLLTFGFALLALWAMQSLARRLDVSPLLACLLLASSSAFLAMGASVMPDVPLLSLTLASVSCLARSQEEDSPAFAVAAGLLAAGAFLCRYTGGIAVALALAYPLLARRKQPRAFLAFAVAGAASLALGGQHLWHTLQHWSAPLTLERLWSLGTIALGQLGAQLPWPFAVPAVLAVRKPRLALAAAAICAGLSLGHGAPLPWLLLCLVFVLPAVAALLDALGRLPRALQAPADAREPLRLLCAVWLGATALETVSYVHVAAKYELLPLPAALLLFLDSLGGLRLRRALLSAAVPATLGLGLLVALSDYRFANLYRSYFDEKPPARYVAGEWGFLYYGEKAGLLPYGGQPLRPEDRVVVAMGVYHPTAPPQRLVEVESARELSYPGPFAILNREAGAGFYSQYWGIFPFVPAAEVTDVVAVLRPRP